jgi:hypothetical protein
MITLPLLAACTTVPKPVPVLEVCPKVPLLELDAPDRDWLGQMRSFLQGTLVTPVDYSLPSKPAKLPTIQ